MAIVERVDREELALYEVLRHPILCGEFINNIDKLEYEEPFEYHYYQNELICDFSSYVNIRAARSVGKTVSLVDMLVWAMINNVFPDDYLVYTVPNKVHLEPVWNGLTRKFRSNSLLKNFIEPNRGINSSSFTIRLLNNSMLDCRIAGQSGTGTNVIGMHTPFEIIDESGYYPWGTWLELQPTLNTWTSGFRQIVSGVPTGLRENNVNYHADQENSNFTKHRVSAYDNPRFTEEDEQRAIEQYGGKDSEDFIHLVLGEHGAPVFSVFDRRLFEISNYKTYYLELNGIKLKEDLAGYVERISFLPPVPPNTGILMGIDLGYTDPSAIVILYRTNNGQFKFHARVKLIKVPYPIQKQIIDKLESKYEPNLIGMDEGHAGVAVTQSLLQDDAYSHKRYDLILKPVNFASWMPLGYDSDGNELKVKIRPFSIQLLQDWSNNHRLVYTSTDLEMVTELERMTYSRTPSGDLIYRTLTPRGGKRGDDHFTSALLSATIAWYMENESLAQRKKKYNLVGSRWLL